MPANPALRPSTMALDGWPADLDFVPSDFGRGTFRIDADGHWYHDGVRMTHPELVRLLASHVLRLEDGRYILRWGPYDHDVEVADTAAVIRSVAAPQPDGEFEARLVDGRTVRLGADHLRVGEAHVLYANMPDGAPVRFSRQAYYQFATWIEPEGERFVVVAGEHRWPITEEARA